MSNLRSDCRDLVAKYDYTLPSDQPYPATTTEMLTLRSHMERACYQIDEVEERWHAAERRAHGLELALITLMRQFPRDDPHRRKAGEAIARWGNPSAVLRLNQEESTSGEGASDGQDDQLS